MRNTSARKNSKNGNSLGPLVTWGRREVDAWAMHHGGRGTTSSFMVYYFKYTMKEDVVPSTFLKNISSCLCAFFKSTQTRRNVFQKCRVMNVGMAVSKITETSRKDRCVHTRQGIKRLHKNLHHYIFCIHWWQPSSSYSMHCLKKHSSLVPKEQVENYILPVWNRARWSSRPLKLIYIWIGRVDEYIATLEIQRTWLASLPAFEAWFTCEPWVVHAQYKYTAL